MRLANRYKLPEPNHDYPEINPEDDNASEETFPDDTEESLSSFSSDSANSSTTGESSGSLDTSTRESNSLASAGAIEPTREGPMFDPHIIREVSRRHVQGRSEAESNDRKSPWVGRGSWYKTKGQNPQLIFIPHSVEAGFDGDRRRSRTAIITHASRVENVKDAPVALASNFPSNSEYIPVVRPEYSYGSGYNPRDLFSKMKVIGKGNSGKVYAATDTAGQRVALKVVSTKENRDGVAMEILMMSSASRRHPNLLTSKKIFQHEGYSWIVMKLMEGTVSQLVKKRMSLGNRMTERQIAYIIREVLKGLEHMHGMNCVHRDIKGENVLISRGKVKIGDFGFVGQLSNGVPELNDRLGTVCWMAPEVIKGHPYGTEVDIWSVGILAIECADGHPPFSYLPLSEALKTIAAPSTPPPQLKNETRATWSNNFHNFISFVLVKNPRRRPDAAACLAHPFIRDCATDYA